MKITIKAHFNKQTKDSKKELVQFYVKGDGEQMPFNTLCREVVELQIDGVEVTLTAEFKKSAKDSKKTILDFEVKGDSSAANTFEFYKKAGQDVELTITESQMSIDEFHDDEPREGLRGTINDDGTIDLDENQMSLDDVTEPDDDLPFTDSDGDDDLVDLEG